MKVFFSREQRFVFVKVLSTCEGFLAENKDLVFVKVLITCEVFFSREQRFSGREGFDYL